MFLHPCLYRGDLNCYHTNWGFDSTSPDGECSVDWTAMGNFTLLYNPKDVSSFFSGHQNVVSNQEQAFASSGLDSLQLNIILYFGEVF